MFRVPLSIWGEKIQQQWHALAVWNESDDKTKRKSDAQKNHAIKLKENLTHIQLCRKTKRKCDTQEKLFEGELPTNVEEQIKPRAHSTFFK